MFAIFVLAILFLFLYNVSKLILSSYDKALSPKDYKKNLTNEMYKMLETYGTDIIVAYEKNIKEIEALIKAGDDAGAREKAREFKNSIKKGLVQTKKDVEEFNENL